LVYFVEPSDKIEELLKSQESSLNDYINKNKKEICETIFEYLEKNFEKDLNKNTNTLINLLKFLFNF
jgi:hypothetical protein